MVLTIGFMYRLVRSLFYSSSSACYCWNCVIYSKYFSVLLRGKSDSGIIETSTTASAHLSFTGTALRSCFSAF